MDETMIRKWNEKIKPDDIVYHLGDFGRMSSGYCKHVVSSLNGVKYLILGNHDKTKMLRKMMKPVLENGFEDVVEGPITIMLYGKKFLLSHYPYDDGLTKDYDDKFKNKTPYMDRQLLCGHIHEKWKRKDNMLNVGVDVWDFYPVSALQIVEEFKK